MTRFNDSDDFLLSHRAFDFPFYVVCLEQQGVPGLDLIRLIRRRNNAGILAISNQEGEGFVSALEAGTDMVLRRDAPEDHLQAAILAIQRRSGPGAQAAAPARAARGQGVGGGGADRVHGLPGSGPEPRPGPSIAAGRGPEP